ncbi:magnesium transporter [Rhodothalassium salexigens DSM 2132]|uniref:Magnesium transporter MgtE n=1 Tax=Rhodothalassium salexigens DSM 2132 TaxID=1188247 RepID=A0A4R2PCW0_RHOSA|nr:magnesium transporter [Rhodothalassium salexigens]MBB4212149.1 magnesium transporter [Rhodothalassium salexigens DSM 2132]MBK1638183.1 magnesium transporter [Rhodothalassium salexigens DSM 2132]TCP33023.1 magnesium transporter [Rhodothalassium salexigens DSM 2132]
MTDRPPERRAPWPEPPDLLPDEGGGTLLKTRSDDDRDPSSQDAHLQVDFVQQVVEAVRREDAAEAADLVDGLALPDLADLFEVLPPSDRRQLAALAGDNLDPAVLPELDGQVFTDVVRQVPATLVAEAVRQLDSDDAIAVIEELDEDVQNQVLRRLAAADRVVIEEGLAYPEESAGRIMQRDLVAVPQFWTVGQTIDYLRAENPSLPDDFYEIIVTDPFHRPVGAIALSRVMRNERRVKIGDIMTRDPHLIDVMADQEDVAYQFNKYHLISAAVIDQSRRLVGVITVDDIVHVVEQEAQEDILALAGVSEGGVNESIVTMTRSRFTWLLVNLGTAVLASAVIGRFEATIQQLVALAVLMPIVASMGGNAGTQTMTVAVRALATKELSAANALRIVNKELLVGLINGALLAGVIGGVAWAWFGDPLLAGVLAAAMVINLAVAGLSGILVPMTLSRLGIDPAVSSTVFVTTITDVIGFLAFLGLAALVLL